MSSSFWQLEEKKFLKAIEGVAIPNSSLDNVEFVSSKETTEFVEIPNEGGCYWIWTTEPVLHSLHKHSTPKPFDGGEIIYNGIAKDNVRSRVVHHLLGKADAGWSGISLDIYFGETGSHRKKALSDKGKVPFIREKYIIRRSTKDGKLKKGDEGERFKAIRNKDDFAKIFLSNEERENLSEEKFSKIYFRNGININDKKHKDFEFRVYYITGLSSLYLDFIEKKWRNDNKWLPKLCSYSSGR